LRRDAPVYQIPESGLWMVTRHADLVEAASKPEIFSSHISAIVYAGQGTNPTVIAADPDAIGAVDVLATQDPPKHTEQRRLMNRTFVHARIAALEPSIAAFVDGALDMRAMDWMEAVANPLPLSVISGLLGMPSSDADRLKEWADAGVDLVSGVASMERLGDCWGLMVGFLEYLRARLSSPEPGSVTAEVAEAVARGDLAEREGVSLLLQLVIAGSESTTSLLGSAVRLLAEDQRLQDEVRADPSRVPAVLEEALRLESPFRGHFRVTTRETTLGDVALPAGARVMLMWGAANRDAEVFEHPDALDPSREHLKQHVAFGSGIHFCIGAPLARLEARIALERLLARTSRFEVQPGATLRHVPSLFVRRLEALPLALHAR
jgi:cytochrome P450